MLKESSRHAYVEKIKKRFKKFYLSDYYIAKFDVKELVQDLTTIL